MTRLVVSEFSLKQYVVEDERNELRIDYSTVGSIAKLSESWKRTNRAKYLPLVVRVLSRSRIRYYGKPSKQDKWPYQVYILTQYIFYTHYCNLKKIYAVVQVTH